MAHSLTIKRHNGLSDETAVDPTNSATAGAVVSGTNFMIGPPVNGNSRMQGRYIREIAGTSGQFRHLRDENIAGAAPTSFTYTTS